ncbi:10734_t:CDS:2, partial [Scutellospora calospora]
MFVRPYPYRKKFVLLSPLDLVSSRLVSLLFGVVVIWSHRSLLNLSSPSYLKKSEIYDPSLHYDKEWLHGSIRTI